jgi:hypothetical protein
MRRGRPTEPRQSYIRPGVEIPIGLREIRPDPLQCLNHWLYPPPQLIALQRLEIQPTKVPCVNGPDDLPKRSLVEALQHSPAH